MDARIDHIVIWVEDPLRAVGFFQDVVGLPGVRVEEFRTGTAPFPSIRVSDESIIDLMARAAAPALNARPGAEGSAGHPVNHVCLAMSREEFESLRTRLAERGVDVSATMQRSFGARGLAPHTFYFHDPDGNVFEARYYS